MALNIAISGTELNESDSIDVLIGLASSCGAHAVELWFPKNFAYDGVSATISKLRTTDLNIASISTSSRLYGSDSETGQQLLREALTLAGQLGAEFVNTYFGHSDLISHEKAIRDYARSLAPILMEAADRGITVTLENEFDFFGMDPLGSDISRSPEMLAKLIALVNSDRFKLNFDAANFVCASVSPSAAYRTLSEHVAYAHVKDVRLVVDPAAPQSPGWTRYSDSGRVFESTRLGDGDVDWPTLLHDMVSSNGYTGYLTLEPHCSRDRLAEELGCAAAFVRSGCHRELEPPF